MRAFLSSEEGVAQARLATERADALMKGVVKRFFNEKEVTSTLVMDALYCGCRALDVGDMPPAEAAKLSSKPNRAVWLSIAQNKVRLVFFRLFLKTRRRANAANAANAASVESQTRHAPVFKPGILARAVRLIAFFVLMRRY
jgi:hypothetical protein